MKADEIERLYQETIFGYDQPEMMCMGGNTLKEMLQRLGDTEMVTAEGEPIVEHELYCMTKKGIFRVE